MIDVLEDLGCVRVDDSGFVELLAAARSDLAGAHVVLPMVGAACAAALDPIATVRVTAAGADIRLVHEFWWHEQGLGVRMALDEDQWQVQADSHGFLPALLATVTRLEPVDASDRSPIPWREQDLRLLVSEIPAHRREALERLAADSVWLLEADHAGRTLTLWGSDGDRGPRVYDAGSSMFLPVTNTEIYRFFSSLMTRLMADE